MDRRRFLTLASAAPLLADEVKLKLPDVLQMADGRKVRTADEWRRLRRPEVLQLFATEQFGRTVGGAGRVRFTQAATERGVLGGKATRKQVTVYWDGSESGPKADLLLYLPSRATNRVPVFVGLNFRGNHAVHADPGIRLPEIWQREQPQRADKRSNELVPHVRKRAVEATRGSDAEAWQVEKILDSGYGLATIYYGDLEPDFNGGIAFGLRRQFLAAGTSEFKADEWGAIGGWAWGLSRVADFLQTQEEIDGRRIALMGHSRLGKTALWAGAQDERFGIVISNDSGEGGAAISRRHEGESVKQINAAFPHWFCRNYRKYSDNDSELPVDAHMLLSLIAPRPLYVASAEEDKWADPEGEFLAASEAGSVYELLGKKGLGTRSMPAIHSPIMHTVGYHIRAGKHAVTAYDWEQYLKFADLHWGKK